MGTEEHTFMIVNIWQKYNRYNHVHVQDNQGLTSAGFYMSAIQPF